MMADRPVSAAELRGFRLFAGQPEGDLAGIAAASRHRSLADRELLAIRGERCATVSLVVSGRVGLSVEQDGHSVLVMTLGPGDMLGWSVLREDPTSLTSSRAVGPTEIIEIPADDLLDAATGGTPLARTLVQRLLGAAADDLEATRAQLVRLGREGPITAG
jgi:CRP-like cAMP-binding protein